MPDLRGQKPYSAGTSPETSTGSYFTVLWGWPLLGDRMIRDMNLMVMRLLSNLFHCEMSFNMKLLHNNMSVDKVFCKPWMVVMIGAQVHISTFFLKVQLMLLHNGNIPVKLISAKRLVGTPESSPVSISAAVRAISQQGLGEVEFKLLSSFIASVSAIMDHASG